MLLLEQTRYATINTRYLISLVLRAGGRAYGAFFFFLHFFPARVFLFLFFVLEVLSFSLVILPSSP